VNDPVSRETPPPPDGVAAAFGDGWPKLQRYADLLADAGVVRGLIGPREVPRIWERHLLNCAQIAPAFAPDSRVCDLGSGAGLPGVVLALARPDLEVILLEPLLRRTTFLTEVVEVLALANVGVVRGRAEDHAGADFDAVTARAVAPLDRLARWALPMCRPGGKLVAIKGVSAEAELEASGAALAKAGARSSRVRELALSPRWDPVVAVEIVAGDTVAAGRPTRRRRS
jgi:16S rRNA (guanine527-N7)-methyltransferase